MDLANRSSVSRYVVELPGESSGENVPPFEVPAVQPAAEAPATRSFLKSRWTVVGALAAVLVLLSGVAFALSRDNKPPASVQTGIGATSTTGHPLATADPGTIIVGTIIPGTEVPGTTPGSAPVGPSTTSKAPVIVTVPAGQPATTASTTTTTAGPCRPDLAVSATRLDPDDGVVLTVQDLSDCAVTNAIVTVDYPAPQGPPTLSAGLWHPPSDGLLGVWDLGPLGAHGSATATFHPDATKNRERTGGAFAEPDGQNDIDPSNNSIMPECVGTLAVHATQHGPATSDGTVTFDFAIQNDGPCPQTVTYAVDGTSQTVTVPADPNDHTSSLTLQLSPWSPGTTSADLVVTNKTDATPFGDLVWRDRVLVQS